MEASSVITIGQVWVDKDKRMLSGRRRVRVVCVESGKVWYVPAHSTSNERGRLRSRCDRFERAFRLEHKPTITRFEKIVRDEEAEVKRGE